MTRRSRPKIRGRFMPERDGISQARTVGQNQDLKEYDLNFVLLNTEADLLDQFFKARDRNNEWFFWTPPGENIRTVRCRQWRRTVQNTKWSLIAATFSETLVPTFDDICTCASIQGALVVGNTLSLSSITCAIGSGTPTAYQWERNGSAISGGTNATYTTISADIGTTITCTINFIDSVGQAATCTTSGVVVQAPPAVTFIGLTTAQDPTQSVAAPTHEVGDLLIVVSNVSNNLPFPSLSGFTQLLQGPTIDSFDIKVQYKIATSTSYTLSSWGSTPYAAHKATILVYRNATIGAYSYNSIVPADYPALTFNNTSGSSWSLRILGRGAGYGYTTPATGYTSRFVQYLAIISDSNTGVSSPTQEIVSGIPDVTFGATIELESI